MASDDLHQRLLAETTPLMAGQRTSVALVNHLLAALRAVVELHAAYPSDGHSKLFECHGCSEYWPCSTIQVIADTLGLTAEQDPEEAHREEERHG